VISETEIHFDGKVAQKAVIVRDGKVLVIRDPREEKIIWEIPGGRMNEGEDPRAGLAREIKEELGINCIIGSIIHLTQYFHQSEGRNALMIAYEATIPENAVLSFADGEICEARWITKDDMADLEFFIEYKDTLAIYFKTQTHLN